MAGVAVNAPHVGRDELGVGHRSTLSARRTHVVYKMERR